MATLPTTQQPHVYSNVSPPASSMPTASPILVPITVPTLNLLTNPQTSCLEPAFLSVPTAIFQIKQL